MRKSAWYAFLLTLVCTLCLCVAVRADEAPRSGDFGEDLYWSLDETGLLLIEGRGEIPDWTYSEPAPWSQYNKEITSARVGAGITGLGKYSFYWLQNLKTLELPESLTSVQPSAVYACDALETLTIPDRVVSMDRAVRSCARMRVLRLGASVASLRVCENCGSLERIEVSTANESLQDIDGVLLSRDGKILCCYPSGRAETRYEVPKGVEKLGTDSFSGLSRLEELVLPEGLYRIDSKAFYSCRALKTMLLPATLRELGSDLLSSCRSDLKLCFDGPEALLAGIHIERFNDALLSLGFELGQEHATLHRLVLNTRRYYPWDMLLIAEGYPIPRIPFPEEETTEERPFCGWFLSNQEDAEELVPGSICTAAEDLTVYARWWETKRMALYPAGGTLNGPEYLLLSEEDGYTFRELPEPPVRLGWRFEAWYLDNGVDASTALGMSFPSGGSLTARWQPCVVREERNADAGVCTSRTLERTGELSSSAMRLLYNRWASPVKNYAVPEEDGSLSCVCAADGALLISRYAPDGTLRGEQTLALELPIFGGFYAGQTYYYVVTGQTNLEEDDAKEVFRVTRYDRDWKRIDALAIRDCYTCIPFDAGSLRMAENGSQLLIHTARERYRSADGLRHQSQLSIWIDTDTMRVVNNLVAFQSNHVSHSFNQFVLPEGEGFALLDHGDAYPRSVVLHHLTQQGMTGRVNLFSIPGQTGANATGVSVGGFAATEGAFTAAINSIDHSLATGYNSYFIEGIEQEQRDILVLSTAADNLAEVNIAKTKLTDYAADGRTGSAPYLVRLGPDLLCALWEEYRMGVRPEDAERLGVRYVFLNGNATPLSDKFLLPDAQLSRDCQPVVWNGRIVWFVDSDRARTLYALDIPETDTAGEPVAVTEAETEDNALCLTVFSALERSKVLCAWYRADGRLLRVSSGEAGFGLNTLRFATVPRGAVCRVFFTDEKGRPLAAPNRVTG